MKTASEHEDEMTAPFRDAARLVDLREKIEARIAETEHALERSRDGSGTPGYESACSAEINALEWVRDRIDDEIDGPPDSGSLGGEGGGRSESETESVERAREQELSDRAKTFEKKAVLLDHLRVSAEWQRDQLKRRVEDLEDALLWLMHSTAPSLCSSLAAIRSKVGSFSKSRAAWSVFARIGLPSKREAFRDAVELISSALNSTQGNRACEGREPMSGGADEEFDEIAADVAESDAFGETLFRDNAKVRETEWAAYCLGWRDEMPRWVPKTIKRAHAFRAESCRVRRFPYKGKGTVEVRERGHFVNVDPSAYRVVEWDNRHAE